MKNIDFPIFKTKLADANQRFDLSDIAERKKYFELKAGPEIAKIKKFLEKNTFVAYLLGKKNTGKGTYSKLFLEIFGEDHVGHVAIGDIVRDVHEGLSDKKRRGELIDFLKKNYRGFHTVAETVQLIEDRDTSSLISSELIVALIKYEISKRPKKAIFIDGFPREFDQIALSLYLKELIGYRDDPDFLVFIDVPENVIDERIKYRVVCPICKTPRNLRLLATKEVGHDESAGEFYLICEDPKCKGQRMVAKEGDKLGIEPIRKRLQVDDLIFKKLLGLQGIPKVYLRNAIPVDKAKESVDDYEITPAYDYSYDKKTKKVKVLEKPWVIKDDNGVLSHSLMPPPIVVSLIKQTVKVLGL